MAAILFNWPMFLISQGFQYLTPITPIAPPTLRQVLTTDGDGAEGEFT